jgi:hypothetical protein
MGRRINLCLIRLASAAALFSARSVEKGAVDKRDKHGKRNGPDPLNASVERTLDGGKAGCFSEREAGWSLGFLAWDSVELLIRKKYPRRETYHFWTGRAMEIASRSIYPACLSAFCRGRQSPPLFRLLADIRRGILKQEHLQHVQVNLIG